MRFDDEKNEKKIFSMYYYNNNNFAFFKRPYTSYRLDIILLSLAYFYSNANPFKIVSIHYCCANVYLVRCNGSLAAVANIFFIIDQMT